MKKRMRISAYKLLESGKKEYQDILECEVEDSFTRKDGKFLSTPNFFLNHIIDEYAAKENHVVEIEVRLEGENGQFVTEEVAASIENNLALMGYYSCK